MPPLGSGLEGRGVLVTGAAGGIGAAVAHAFADSGAQVVLCDVRASELERVAAELPGGEHRVVAADLSDIGEHARIVEEAERASGGLVALAHLAAILHRAADVASITEADWDAQADLNLKASFFLNRTFAEHLRDAGRPGAIVNFTSQAWWTGGFGGSVVYSALKGGIVTLTRGLARTYAPLGIRVNAISPGLIKTRMIEDDLPPAVLSELVDQIPAGRIGEPADVAPATVFLASQHARYITGATLNVSGGFLMY